MRKILFVQTNYPDFLSDFYSSVDADKLSYKQIKNKWAKEFFGSADFYGKNLSKLGWKSEEVILNDWVGQSKWCSEHSIKITKNPFPLIHLIPPRLSNLFNLEPWKKKVFWEQVNYYKPDIVYNHDLSILSASDIKKLKNKRVLVVGQIAYPLPLNKKPLYKYDLIISSFPHYVRMFGSWGINSEYLPWCVEETIVKTIGNKKRKYDVAYVGGLTPHHKKGNILLTNLAREIDIDVWGYGEKSLPANSPILKKFHGQAWGRQMYEIFAQSKIVVNRHIDISGKFANNMRMYEATAMGALLITDKKSNMDEFFEVGKEVVTYQNAKDLVKKVKYYLKHPKEAEKIAKAGQKRTLKDHTYTKRMKTLDKILKKYLKDEV